MIGAGSAFGGYMLIMLSIPTGDTEASVKPIAMFSDAASCSAYMVRNNMSAKIQEHIRWSGSDELYYVYCAKLGDNLFNQFEMK